MLRRRIAEAQEPTRRNQTVVVRKGRYGTKVFRVNEESDPFIKAVHAMLDEKSHFIVVECARLIAPYIEDSARG
jgi:hypothetical protein